MTEQNEPSMEDILASIRNILADEEEKDAGNKNPERQKVAADNAQRRALSI